MKSVRRKTKQTPGQRLDQQPGEIGEIGEPVILEAMASPTPQRHTPQRGAEGSLPARSLWRGLMGGGAIALIPLALGLFWGQSVRAQSTIEEGTPTALCPAPALARVKSHIVAAGETLDEIATRYGLLPATLAGMNPAAQVGVLSPGQVVRVPPFNGIEVSVRAGKTWQTLAEQYRVQADVLFEVNGCPGTVPSRIFVPGVNWFPGVETAMGTTAEVAPTDPLSRYPLSVVAPIVQPFGWQTHPERDELIFNSGVTLAVSPETTVLAAGGGTVAYAGWQGEIAMVVINHAQGFQTRYGNLRDIRVTVGQRVTVGEAIATVAAAPSIPGEPSPELSLVYFEVRTNSALGWVARNPGDYIPELAVR